MVSLVLDSPLLGKPPPNRWSGLKRGGPSKVARHPHLADEDSGAPGIPQGNEEQDGQPFKGLSILGNAKKPHLPRAAFPNFCIFSCRSPPPNKP